MIAGCGSGSSDGPQRYEVSGTVTFEGKPVPKGFIMFTPDTSKGVSGPGSGAEIANGSFKTASGKGVVGGAHIVEITGTDGIAITESGEELPDGTELFSKFKTEFDFPKENQTKDFEVPVPSTD